MDGSGITQIIAEGIATAPYGLAISYYGKLIIENYFLTDFKNASPIIPHFLGNIMKNRSVVCWLFM